MSHHEITRQINANPTRHEYLSSLDTHPHLQTQTKPKMTKVITPEVTLSKPLVKLIVFNGQGQVLVEDDNIIPCSEVTTTELFQAQLLLYTSIRQGAQIDKLVHFKTLGNVAYYLYTVPVLDLVSFLGNTFKERNLFLYYPTASILRDTHNLFKSLQPKPVQHLQAKLSVSNLQSLIALVSKEITTKECNIQEAKDLVSAIPKDYKEDKTELFKHIQCEQHKIKKLVSLQTVMKRIKASGG